MSCTCEWLGDCACEGPPVPVATPAKACKVRLKTGKGRDVPYQEPVTASEINPTTKKEIPMTNGSAFPKAPAGFRLEHVCSCGMGCTPEDLNTADNCEIIGSNHAGPGAHLTGSSGVQVNSYWTAEHGITFQVLNYRDNGHGEYGRHDWTRDELAQLPAVVESVLGQIDEAHAREYFSCHPGLLSSIRTANDMTRVSVEHNIHPAVVCEVWAEVNADQLDMNPSEPHISTVEQSGLESASVESVPAGVVPEDIIVTDEYGIPSFVFNMEAMQTDALALAGRVAADCDNPEVVRGHLTAMLAKLGRENADNAYTGALFMRALQYLAEDLFAPVMDIVERTLPGHNFRQHLHAIGADIPKAPSTGSGVTE